MYFFLIYEQIVTSCEHFVNVSKAYFKLYKVTHEEMLDNFSCDVEDLPFDFWWYYTFKDPEYDDIILKNYFWVEIDSDGGVYHIELEIEDSIIEMANTGNEVMKKYYDDLHSSKYSDRIDDFVQSLLNSDDFPFKYYDVVKSEIYTLINGDPYQEYSVRFYNDSQSKYETAVDESGHTYYIVNDTPDPISLQIYLFLNQD